MGDEGAVPRGGRGDLGSRRGAGARSGTRLQIWHLGFKRHGPESGRAAGDRERPRAPSPPGSPRRAAPRGGGRSPPDTERPEGKTSESREVVAAAAKARRSHR